MSRKKVITERQLSEQPIPSDLLQIVSFEISLNLETGNMIYEKFDNVEDLLNFLQEYTHNPTKILERITPKKKQP